MNHLNKPLATVLVVSWTLGITSAHGQLRYDLRFDDDTRTRVPAVGEHTVNLFARVTGLDTDHTNDGMGWSFVSIAGEQIGGGAVAGAIASGTRRYPFDLVGRDGIAADFNADGFGDWGSIVPDSGDLGYMFAHVAPHPLAYQTRLQIITPTFHASVFGPYYATFRRDGSLLGVTTQSASPFGAFVTFAVPEPGGIGSLCIGAALLARRRRTSAAVQHTTA